MTTETNTQDTVISERIRALMYRLKMNQTQVAEYLQVPQTTVSNWLTGKRQPNASLIRLLDVLGMVEAVAPGIHVTFLPKREPRTRRSQVQENEATKETTI